MSASFDITDQPAQVYLGDQSTVTLVNDGPFTLYFDESSGVDSLNGFELPPTGQMVWKGSRPLWARCRSFVPFSVGGGFVPPGFVPRSKLRTTIAGELSLTTRAKFFRHLFVGPPFASNNTAFIEVGHCNSLLVNYTFSAADSASFGAAFNTNIFWFDEEMQLITAENWTARITPAGLGFGPPGAIIPTARFSIPVHGKYASFSDNYTAFASRKLSIVGTDAVLPSRSDGGLFLPVGVTGSWSYNGRSISASGWTGAGTISFPANGDVMSIGISNPGAAAQVLITEVTTGQRLALLNVPAGADSYQTVNIPTNTTCVLSAVAAVLNASVLITWPNELVNS